MLFGKLIKIPFRCSEVEKPLNYTSVIHIIQILIDLKSNINSAEFLVGKIVALLR